MIQASSGPAIVRSAARPIAARSQRSAQVHMTTQNGRAFNEWLRAQLKAKKMSQRQLAQQSGVDHSTISRLIRGDRMPSLGTATKLARGLRELRDDADTPQYLRPGRGRRQHQSDRSGRIRASRRRTAERGAGPPDHGVLPRRPDAPVRPIVPADREPNREPRTWRRRSLHGPLDARQPIRRRWRSAAAPPRSARSAPSLVRRAGNRGATSQHTSRLGSALPARVWGTANAGVWAPAFAIRRFC